MFIGVFVCGFNVAVRFFVRVVFIKGYEVLGFYDLFDGFIFGNVRF